MNEGHELLLTPAESRSIISDRLIDWYHTNKRALPWRETQDPYKIWISEIILQQTRVDQGMGYYLRFIERFPDVKSLAEAHEEEVLKYWQGLGYYSRARNLHAAAKSIVYEQNGQFPEEHADVIQLKGVGEYTAAAIVSFAWNKPFPTVDGNVFRFLSRLLAIDEPIDTGKGKKLFTETARLLMDDSQAGLFNQAMMEFGALQCVPSAPNCRICPFIDQCMAYDQSKVNSFPVKQHKTKTQDRYLYYFHIHDGSCTYLNKRQGKGVWHNLYEFPAIESETPLTFDQLISNQFFQDMFQSADKAGFRLVLANKKHILSHRRLFADFYEVFPEKNGNLSSFFKVEEKDIDNYPTHRLMEIYMEKHLKKRF